MAENSEGSGGAGAPAASAAGAQPGAGGGAPPAGGAPEPRPGKKSKASKDVVHIPQAEFLKRVRRMSERECQEALGMSLAEAKALIDRAQQPQPAAPGGQQPAPELAALQTSLAREKARGDRLAQDLEAAKGTITEKRRRIKRLKSRSREDSTAAMIRYEARAAGITDEHADFAVNELRKAIQTNPRAVDMANPGKFFEGLRATRPYLFASAAPPPPAERVEVRPSSAAPESRAPGGGPTGTPPAPVEVPVDVNAMSPAEFKRYRREKFGYNGG